MSFPPEVEQRLSSPDRPALNKRPFFEESDYSHVVLIILDGVSANVLKQAKVPYITSLRNGGAYYANCFTSFPTMTHSAHSSINTGSYPENHGSGLAIGGVSPRADYLTENLRYIPASLKAAGLTASCIADQTLRGAFSYLSVEYFGHSISKCGALARWNFETLRPSFLSVTFYATDSLSHAYGPGNEFTLEALEQIDQEIAELAECIDRTGNLDKTLFMIASDHGQVGAITPVYEMFDAYGQEGVDFVPSAGGRTVVLHRPTDKQLGQWAANEMVQRILSPVDLGVLGHHCDPEHYVVCLKEGSMWSKTHNSSLHGGLAREERNVPLILSGPGVRTGRYEQIAEGIDIAPTATALLGGHFLESYQGRILSEAFEWKSPVSPAKVIDWRRKREQWLDGDGTRADWNTSELLAEKRNSERNYKKAVFEHYQRSCVGR